MGIKLSRRFLCVVFLVAVFTDISSADLIFKITADKYALAVGEEAVISIFAKIDDEDGVAQGYALNGWQLDMVVVDPNSDLLSGVVEVSKDPIFIEPEAGFWDSASGWLDLNSDATGNVYGLGAFTSGPTDSNLCLGQFSELARVTIEAIGTVGQQVIYELTDYTQTTGFWGALRDDTSFPTYIYPDNVSFQPGNNVFTIVPEPASLLLMALSTLLLRKRKVGSKQ